MKMELSKSNAAKWFSTLPLELKSTIKKLHKPVPVWRWVPLLFVGIWIFAATIMLTFPYVLIKILCILVIGFMIHGLAIALHECAHGNMFRRPKLDYWIGFLLGIPALFSMTAYRVTHLLHHKYNRTPDDPDEFTNISSNQRLLSLAFYSWTVIGMPLYLFHIALTALMRGTTKERLTVLFEESMIIGIAILVVRNASQTGYMREVLLCWIIPLAVAAFMANFRAWSEHTMTRPGNIITQSRTVISNKWISFVLLNQNYHLEHHLFPALPWYQLPKVHQLLQEEYKRENSFIYKSYSKFIWEACRKGVHYELPSAQERAKIWSS